MTDHDAEIEQILSELADRSSPCARVFRHWEGRHVSVRPVDFYQVLKRCEDLVVRLDITGVTPINCRVRNGTVEFATDLYDEGTASRTDFLDKVSKASSVEVIHHADSEFVDVEDNDQDVRADGGMSLDESGRPGGAGECPQGCHHPVAGRDTLETREETVPIEPPAVFEVYGETVVQTERVRRYTECIVCGWVIDI